MIIHINSIKYKIITMTNSIITLTGWTSFSNKFVRSNRTPQLISKPTPPGETIDSGSSISNAAIFPTNKTF